MRITFFSTLVIGAIAVVSGAEAISVKKHDVEQLSMA